MATFLRDWKAAAKRTVKLYLKSTTLKEILSWYKQAEFH